MKPHYHWIIRGYNKEDSKTGQLWGYCDFHLEAKTADEAIAKAKQLQEKNYYGVVQVRECFVSDNHDFVSETHQALTELRGVLKDELPDKEPWEEDD